MLLYGAIVNEAAYANDLGKCSGGVCDPAAMHPAPITHPVDGDDSDAPPLCPPGTHGCPLGPNGAYCCYGTDICCGGICCIVEVGCACVG